MLHLFESKDRTVTKLLRNRDKSKLWLCEIGKNPGFIGAP